MVQDGQLTMGHARALLVLRNARKQTDLANEAVRQGLSVRDTESRARAIGEADGSSAGHDVTPRRPVRPPAVRGDPAIVRAEERLRRRLQTDVGILRTDGERGTVKIAFYSTEDLERVLDLIAPDADDFD